VSRVDSHLSYDSKDASHIEHRASEEYKAFREACGREELLVRPSDLQFWHPAGVGFINKGTPAAFPEKAAGSELQYIITDEFKANTGEKMAILERLANIAAIARKNEAVLSFWVLGRVRDDGSVVPEVDEDSLYLFLRCENKDTSDIVYEKEETLADWEDISLRCVNRRKTTWVESGIGFLGR
jgi:quinol monooxygenase YgiN